MKTIFAGLILGSCLFGLIWDVPVQEINYQIINEPDGQQIHLKKGAAIGRAGAPALPLTGFSRVLPRDQRIKSISVLETEYDLIPGSWNIAPEPPAEALDQPPLPVIPDTSCYNSALPYPANPVISFHSGNLRGISIGQVDIVPFKYEPKLKRLWVLKKIRLQLETVNQNGTVRPARQTRLSAEIFNRLIKNIAPEPFINFTDIIEPPADDPPAAGLPSLIGPPVDLLIITTDQQADAYQKYGQFRKKFGFLTCIRTMSWINTHYSGVDDAERVRRFIRDAVEKWGVAFVLLGGDPSAVPTRIATMQPLVGPWPTHIATDLYFSDLDGDWNHDGDKDFGEIEDSLDLYPDVLIGRLPTHSDTDIVAYQEKLRSYLMPQDPVGFNRALFVSADWWSQGDARAAASRLAQHLPAHFDTNFINEPTLQQFKDSLSSNWNMIGVLAHGDVNLLRIKSNPRTFATNFFFDSLGPTEIIHPLMWAITCYTNPFQLDALGEHWVMNRQAGGIGYIGPSYSSSAGDNEAYTAVMLDSLFSLSLSGAVAYTKVFWIPQSIYWDNWKRSFQFSLNLLADPSVTLWDTIPSAFGTIIRNKDTLRLGIDTLTISIASRIKFYAVFYKPGNYFAKDSGWGIINTKIKTSTPGWFHYSILAHGFKPHLDSIYVQPDQPRLIVNGLRLIDSLGMPNGIINPGEDISLFINLVNNGAITACSVRADITCSDTLVTILQGASSYHDINPLNHAENLWPFKFRVAKTLPDEHDLVFDLAVSGVGFSQRDSFQLMPQAPIIDQFGQNYAWRGDTVHFILQLQNRGHQTADSVKAFISALSDTVAILDSMVCFPALMPGSVLSSIPDSFAAIRRYAGNFRYRLRVADKNQTIINRTIQLDSIHSSDSIWTEGIKTGVVIKWRPVLSACGYRVYRSNSAHGPFERITVSLEKTAYLMDTEVEPETDYWYFVTAVDSSWHEGPASDTAAGCANPPLKSGWPQIMRGWCFSSPNYGEIDPGYHGLEIVVGGKDGCLYGWHSDGSPLAGNDGILLATPGQIWGSPAVGDVNRDGLLDICIGIRGLGENNLYVVDRHGAPLPGWPKSVDGGVLTSPVLSDINADGFLEIFVISENSKLYAFRYNGEGLFNESGVLKQLSGGSFGSPAIGDINQDGTLEIVCHGGEQSDTLFVWDHTGHYLPPFPVTICSRMRFSTVLADVCGDRNLEIIFYTDSTECLNVVDHLGHLIWQRNFSLDDVEAGPIIADIAGTERPEIICGNNLGLVVFDSTGAILPGFPLYGMEHNWKLPVAADLDGDSAIDIVSGSSEWCLYAHAADGSQLRGFPISMGGGVECSPAVADIDGDGNNELMTGDNGFKFYVYKLTGTKWEWPKFRYDQFNTGCYQSGNWLGAKTDIGRSFSKTFFLKATPVPFRNRLKISYRVFSIPSSDLTKAKKEPGLKIYDATGRLVRFFPITLSPDEQRVIWDGTDQRGRALPDGVYFIHLCLNPDKAAQKVIRIK